MLELNKKLIMGDGEPEKNLRMYQLIMSELIYHTITHPDLFQVASTLNICMLPWVVILKLNRVFCDISRGLQAGILYGQRGHFDVSARVFWR